MRTVKWIILALSIGFAIAAGCSPSGENTTGGAESGTNNPSNPGATTAVNFDTDVKPALNTFCAQCHTGPDAKDGVDVTKVTAADKDKLKMLAEQVETKKMPPEKAPKHPTDAERAKLVADLKALAG